MAKTTFTFCADYQPEKILAALRDLLEPWGGMKAFVSPGERVLLKPNLLLAKEPEAAVTTHPALVGATAQLVLEAGAHPFVGDSPSIGSFKKVAEKTGITRVCQELNIPLVEFKETEEVKADNGTFQRIALAKAALKADAIINLPKLKTHGMMTLTLAVKNLFGCVVGTEKPQWHLKAGVDKGAFAHMLLDIAQILRPRLNILDGLWAMEGEGPTSGDKKFLGILGAGDDPRALDFLVARHLSIPIQYVPTLIMGATGPRPPAPEPTDGPAAKEREFLTTVTSSDFPAIYLHPKAKNLWGTFALPKGMDVEWGLPEFLKKGLKNHLTPQIYLDPKICTRCLDCQKICPPQVIHWSNKSKAPTLFIDQRRCIHCYCCHEVCPQGAVKTKEGLNKVLKKILG